MFTSTLNVMSKFSIGLTEHTNYSIDTIMAWYRGFKEDCPDGRLTPQVTTMAFKLRLEGNHHHED